MVPAYREFLTIKELQDRANELRESMRECVLCPHQCRARRTVGRYGVCRTTEVANISAAAPHYGEEPPLVGSSGSGTIFFSSCNLKCAFCQNYEISQLKRGWPVSALGLAQQMLRLQNFGCHNINFVTPTHVVPQIVEALVTAVERGLRIPLVYNCGGYESVATLRLLENIVDIYMPDIKYSDNGHSKRYSGAPEYWDVVRSAVREMQRQVGDLLEDREGVARRGLLVRHLVLPGRIAGSKRVIEFIAREISVDCYVNVMDQYRPSYRAEGIPALNRCITADEFDEVIVYARKLGLHRGFAERTGNGRWRMEGGG